jgi:glycine oxidase
MEDGLVKKNFRVAIIGGSIIGCLTAWRLAQRGAEPIIVERGRIGHESSWAGAGILCPIQPWLYPDAFTRLIEASLALYPDLQNELQSHTGISPQWLKSGLIVPFFPDDAVNHRQVAIDWSNRFGWRVEQLDARQAKEAEPALADDVQSALLWPDVGQVRNPRLLKALRALLQSEGVEIRGQTEVEGLIEKAGRVCGVHFTDESILEADAVLLAAGGWSGVLGEQFGISLPVKPVKGQIILLKSQPGRLTHIVKHDRAYFVPRQDGRILVGASMESVGFKRGNTVVEMHGLLNGLLRLTPQLAHEQIEHQWMGFRPGTPDGLPFLGPIHEKPGLWVASGHYRNGVALAPITAEIMSGWMLGKQPDMDMTCFLPNRSVQPSSVLGFPDTRLFPLRHE